MRYPGSKTLESSRIIEQSHLPVRGTLAQIGVPSTTFAGGMIATSNTARKGWKSAPHGRPRSGTASPIVREQIVQMALSEPDLSPRELAVRFTDPEKYFVSETSVYRLL